MFRLYIVLQTTQAYPVHRPSYIHVVPTYTTPSCRLTVLVKAYQANFRLFTSRCLRIFTSVSHIVPPCTISAQLTECYCFSRYNSRSKGYTSQNFVPVSPGLHPIKVPGQGHMVEHLVSYRYITCETYIQATSCREHAGWCESRTVGLWLTAVYSMCAV